MNTKQFVQCSNSKTDPVLGLLRKQSEKAVRLMNEQWSGLDQFVLFKGEELVRDSSFKIREKPIHEYW